MPAAPAGASAAQQETGLRTALATWCPPAGDCHPRHGAGRTPAQWFWGASHNQTLWRCTLEAATLTHHTWLSRCGSATQGQAKQSLATHRCLPCAGCRQLRPAPARLSRRLLPLCASITEGRCGMLNPADGLDSNEAFAQACLWQTLEGGCSTQQLHSAGAHRYAWPSTIKVAGRVRPGSPLQLPVSSIWATSGQALRPEPKILKKCARLVHLCGSSWLLQGPAGGQTLLSSGHHERSASAQICLWRAQRPGICSRGSASVCLGAAKELWTVAVSAFACSVEQADFSDMVHQPLATFGTHLHSGSSVIQ